MAQDSKAKRRLRRVKRERTLAYKLFDLAITDRNNWRALAIKAEADAKLLKEGAVVPGRD